MLSLKSLWISETKNYFDGRINNWYALGPSSIFIFGLLKERPILDHHAKAHIHEIWWISGEIQQIFYGFQVKSSGFQVKSSRFHTDFMKSGRFQVRSTGFHTNFT